MKEALMKEFDEGNIKFRSSSTWLPHRPLGLFLNNPCFRVLFGASLLGLGT